MATVSKIVSPQKISIQPYHLVVIVVFLALGLFNLLHHELWRDELQSWALTCHSRTLAELYQNTRYEGHPLLWYLILFLITSFTSQLIAMQLVHLLIATAAIMVFLLYAPFSKLQKILFSFGYFTAYEYCVISRNYGISVLLLFLCCVLLTRKDKNYTGLGVLLVLLSQTNIFYTILAALLAGYTLLDYWLYPPGQATRWMPNANLMTGAFIFIIGLAATAYVVMPPADGGWATDWNLQLKPGLMVVPVTYIWDSYVPVPELARKFWNTNVLDWLGTHLFADTGRTIRFIKLFLSTGILVYVLLLFVRQPTILFLFGVGTLAILGFSYVKYLPFMSMRHLGSLFFLFIASYWLSRYVPLVGLPFRSIALLSDFCNKYRQAVLTTLLAAGVLGSGVSMLIDYQYAFSGSQAVAEYIEESGYKDYPTAGIFDYAMTPIAVYLGKDIYYPQSGRWGSYIIWDKRRTGASQEACLQKTLELTNTSKHDVLILFSHKPKASSVPLVKLREFANVITDDTYYIYLMKYPAPTAITSVP